MATSLEFKSRFPEFIGVEDVRIDLFLADTATFMSSKGKWLDMYDMAQSYYAAHLLTVSEFQFAGDSGAVAPLRKREVDDVITEVAIGDVEPNYNELQSTSYGKRYIQIRKICLTGMRHT